MQGAGGGEMSDYGTVTLMGGPGDGRQTFDVPPWVLQVDLPVISMWRVYCERHVYVRNYGSPWAWYAGEAAR